jgi:hypothetical protein
MKLQWISLWLAAVPVLAQESAEIDMEARRQSVVTLERHIGQREARLEDARADLRERGEKLEARIGEIVGMLAKLRDSESSKTRVSRLKGEVIGGLKGMIQVFNRERAEIVERLRAGRAGAVEDFERDIRAIDAAVARRSAEIVKLVESMPAGQDVEKYERDGEIYFDGVVYENSRISEAWRQNRRDRVQTEKTRRELQDALDGAIGRLERQVRLAREDLETRRMTDAEREINEQELAHAEELLEQRRAQRLELTAPSTPAASDASRQEADDMRRLFDDARRDLAAEFSKVLALYGEIVEEREKIHRLRETLDARKAWLREHDPEGGTSR